MLFIKGSIEIRYFFGNKERQEKYGDTNNKNYILLLYY